MTPFDYVELLDWRRRVTALYAAVRAADDAEAAWGAWREGRDRLFREHPQSPLEPAAREAFEALPYFDYDPRFRLPVSLEPVAGAAPFAADQQKTVTLLPFATTRGLDEALGGELTLYWLGGYGGGVFLPFRDGSSGRACFAGGRYILDTIKGADLGMPGDGTAILDFNFAYNPSCAYAGRWLCPMPPSENRLPSVVAAGEQARDFLGR